MVSGLVTTAITSSIANGDYIEVINLQESTAAIPAIAHTVGKNK